jgi:hypothetical protein
MSWRAISSTFMMFIWFSLFVMFPRISGVYPYDEQAVHGPTARQQINRFEPTDSVAAAGPAPLRSQHSPCPAGHPQARNHETGFAA